MKKKILFLFLFLPFVVIAQQDSTRHDTLILDKFFNLIGTQIKKIFTESPVGPTQQDQSSTEKLKFGFSILYLASGHDDFFEEDEYLSPAITLFYKKSVFSLGPRFYSWDILEGKFSNPGLQFTYRINPFREHKFLDFYLYYNFGFLKDKYSYMITTHAYNDTTQIDVQAHRTSSTFENIIGYGIKLNIYKGLYIFQSYGIGLACQKNSYKFDTNLLTSGSYIDSERKNQFIAGMGYRFK